MTDLLKALRTARALVVLPVASALLVGAATALAANLSGDGTLVGSTGNDNANAGGGSDTIWGGGAHNSINVEAMTPSTAAPAVLTP